MKLSNDPPPEIVTVQIADERLTFEVEGGRAVSVPPAFYPTLMLGSSEDRADQEICHVGVMAAVGLRHPFKVPAPENREEIRSRFYGSRTR
jgi:hypothetical protein